MVNQLEIDCIYARNQYLLQFVKHRWFSGRIVACHAIDPGSIPGRCTFFDQSTKTGELDKLNFRQTRTNMVNQLEIDCMYGRNQYLLQFVKHRWFSGRIVACHAIDPGSIPRRCTFFEQSTKTGELDKLNFQQTRSNMVNQLEIDCMYGRNQYLLQLVKHRWFSGRIVACHAIDPGSIPRRCTFFEQSTKTGELDKLNFQQTRSNMVNQLEKDCMYGRNQYLLQFVKHRWFSGRIVACHAIDPGSIPRRCTFFEQSTKTGELDKLNFQQTRSNMVNQLEIDCMYGRNQYLLQFVKHRWFSGRIVACHAIDPGSIPGRCTFFEQSTKTGELDKLNFQQTRSNMVNQLEIDCMYGRNQYLLQFVKHRWFSGRIVACHAIDPGSIPRRCTFFEQSTKTGEIDKLNFQQTRSNMVNQL